MSDDPKPEDQDKQTPQAQFTQDDVNRFNAETKRQLRAQAEAEQARLREQYEAKMREMEAQYAKPAEPEDENDRWIQENTVKAVTPLLNEVENKVALATSYVLKQQLREEFDAWASSDGIKSVLTPEDKEATWQTFQETVLAPNSGVDPSKIDRVQYFKGIAGMIRLDRQAANLTPEMEEARRQAAEQPNPATVDRTPVAPAHIQKEEVVLPGDLLKSDKPIEQVMQEAPQGAWIEQAKRWGWFTPEELAQMERDKD